LDPMRINLVIGLGLAALAVTACGNSTTVAGPCSGTGAATTINATDSRAFSPGNATITHGQTVCWQNIGTVLHTVTSDDYASPNVSAAPRSFASVPSGFTSSLPPGQAFAHTFPTAGSVLYHCMNHPGMTGTITVN